VHDAGYVPCTKSILHDVEEEEKVFHLCHHCVKLAVMVGLINTAPGTPLRIRKFAVAKIVTLPESSSQK
jgi:hypothetical protein